MNVNERHARLLTKVNDLLSAYISVHDDIFGGSWLRKLLPLPYIFRTVPFDEHLDRLRKVRRQLKSVRKELIGSIGQPSRPPPSGLTQEGLAIEAALSAYLEDLLKAVNGLSEICLLLAAKADGKSEYDINLSFDLDLLSAGRRDSGPWPRSFYRYRKLVKKYDTAVSAYVRQGERLNRTLQGDRQPSEQL